MPIISDNPICIMLPEQFNNALATLEKVKKFQTIIKSQIDTLVATTDLNSYLNAIPDIPITFDTSQLNSILASCPGVFGSVDDINLELAKGMKDFLKAQKINPLGGLSALNKSLEDKMKPINDLMNNALGWLNCMKNLCGLEQALYNSYLGSLNVLKTDIGLVDGKPNVLSPSVTSINDSFKAKTAKIKADAKLLTAPKF